MVLAMHRHPGLSSSLVTRVLALAALVTLAAACGGPATAAPGPASAASAAPAPAPAAADPCPPSIWQSGQSQGGACLQPAVLGEESVNACGARLEQAGWQPDPQAATLIAERVGQPVRCWRAPAP
jgi:hypothetical protein